MIGISVLLVGAVAYWIVYPHWVKFQLRRQFALDIANVKLIQGPRLICSEWEGDQGVLERAQDLRGLLAHAGNEWIEPQDIIVRTYSPFADGKTRLTFEAWKTMVDAEFAAICARHYNKVHGMGQFEAPLHGQKVNVNGVN